MRWCLWERRKNKFYADIFKRGKIYITMKKNFIAIFFIFSFSLLFSQPEKENYSLHYLLGNPSNAAHDVNNPTNYLIEKPQYVLSYHRFYGIPNWVAWHLDSTWLGSFTRSNDFRADTALPLRWYRVTEKSYRKSGFDRGHMCPSGDRTNTAEDNSITFLMTNIIPQAANNNQGPWAELEHYCRELARAGNELYIYSGGYGVQKMIDSGRVLAPLRTWKIIVVLPAGENDIERITDSTRVITVDMPNSNSEILKRDDWKNYRTTVAEIERKTGFDFLSNVPKKIQNVIEKIIDSQ